MLPCKPSGLCPQGAGAGHQLAVGVGDRQFDRGPGTPRLAGSADGAGQHGVRTVRLIGDRSAIGVVMHRLRPVKANVA